MTVGDIVSYLEQEGTGRWWRNIRQWDGRSKIGVKEPQSPIHSRAEIMKYPRVFRIQDTVGILQTIIKL